MERLVKFIALAAVTMAVTLQTFAANSIDAERPDATVSRLSTFTLTEDEHNYSVLGNGDTSIARPLDIVMNFKANETREEADAGKYGKWLCDFYLTFSGLSGDSISAAGSYLAGHYGTFGWWVIPTDEFGTLKGDTLYPVMEAKGISLEYATDICGSVKDFTAAIFINRDVLAANPNMTVTLDLRMTNPDNADDQIVIGSYTYTAAMLGNPVAPAVTVNEGVAADNAFKASVGNALAAANKETSGGLTVKIAEKTENSVTYDISGGEKSIPDDGLKMKLPVVGFAEAETAYVVHNHGTKKYVYQSTVTDGCVTINNTAGFSDFTVSASGLAEALAAGGEVVLGSDFALSAMLEVPAGKTVTLDLNGYAITVPEAASGANHIYALNNKGVLTIKDTSAEGTGSISARGIYNGWNGSNIDEAFAGAKMTVESGKFVALDSNGGAAVFNCAELIVNGGVFEGKAAALNTRAKGVAVVNSGTFRSTVGYAIQQNNGGQLTINNATVDAGFGAVGVFGGTTVINNGTFLPTGVMGKTCYVVYVHSGVKVTINGGMFKMNYSADAVPDSGHAVASYYGVTLSITGGTFLSHFGKEETDGGINWAPVQLSAGSVITGGTFLSRVGEVADHPFVKNYIAEGYELNEDGTVVKICQAKIGDTEYVTFEEAIAAAVSNDVVKVMKDVTLAATMTIPADKDYFTLDLNGRAVSGADDSVKLVNLGELAVKDSSEYLEGNLAVPFENGGKAYLLGGLFLGGVVNTGTVEATGGIFTADVTRSWIPAGYACGKVDDFYVVAKLPTATVSPVSDAELDGAPDLTYSLRFKANDVSLVQMLCFTNWYADFELTVSKDVTFNESKPESDGFLAGSYDSWLKGAWVSVPTTNVTIKAGEPLRVMDYGAELLGKRGLKMTYGEIATTVKVFRCGVVLRDAFLKANPGFKVGLSLKMYNPENEAECYTIGSAYEFTVPQPTDSATVEDIYGNIVNCGTMAEVVESVVASGAAANGGEVSLLQNTTIAEDLTMTGTDNLFVNIDSGKTLTLGTGKKFALSNVNVAFIGEGALSGFTADNVTLDDKSVLTLPASESTLAAGLEAKGNYVTENEDGTWSVAKDLKLQIQMADGEPSIGFLKDTRRTYTIEASSDLVNWETVSSEETAGAVVTDSAVPLKWKTPSGGQFFRVKAN